MSGSGLDLIHGFLVVCESEMDVKESKFLITGADGQLAREFETILAQRNISFRGLSKTECDITDQKVLSDVVESVKPDVILNCAAYCRVDQAETEPRQARLVNATAVGQLATLCKGRGIFLVHYSTDYVFDGEKKGYYVEEDPAYPINHYGKTKFEGEEQLQNGLRDFLIFRTSWLFGPREHNFLARVRLLAKEQEVLRIDNEQTSVPTYTRDVVEGTLFSLQRGLKGLFHLVSREGTTRYIWAKHFAERTGLKNKIEPVAKDFFKDTVQRPANTCMSNAKLAENLGMAFPGWREAVEKYVTNEAATFN
ncbi:MAG: dTDP-4-dehydrorhamnose reductase [Candidatus Omnitrophica bacterium]|nr:dTDP-4-dehydrorhamnose reductase [Candidatus Omnitrophota bacterium]